MTASRDRNRDPRGGSERRIIDRKFTDAGFAVLRTPLLPTRDYLRWSDGLVARKQYEAATAGSGTHRTGEEWSAALAADRKVLRERLKSQFSRAELSESLFLASPDLESKLPLWLDNGKGLQAEKFERAIVRYFQRLACRSTPFGLFAGCSMVDVEQSTELRLTDRTGYWRRSRLDMEYLDKAVRHLSLDPSIQKHLLFYPNNSLDVSDGKLHYTESRITGRGRSHHLVSVETDGYLDLILSRARGGAALSDLAQALVAMDPEIEIEDAQEFLEELAATQILVSELELTVTGRDPLDRLLDQLDGIESAVPFRDALTACRSELADIDARQLGGGTAIYRKLADRLAELPVDFDLNRLFQVDMWKPAPGASLSSRVTNEVMRGVELLAYCAIQPRETPLMTFKKEFLERYGDQEVPLFAALDEESGIGFAMMSLPAMTGSPVLKGIPLGGEPRDSRVTWTPWHGHLLKRLDEFRTGDVDELEITEKEIRRYNPPNPTPLPDAFSVMASVIGKPGSDPGVGDDVSISFSTISGPSGANILGRFCHLDEDLEQSVKTHLKREEDQWPDAVFAEIIHLPQGRMGNILYRPKLRDYEIPYLGRSSVSDDKQIPIDDLMVSVRNNWVVLRSKSLDREVIPRMATAHNYRSFGLGIYKFLCSLQNQHQPTMPGWSWGPLRDARALPRVRCGRCILSLAIWNLMYDDYKASVELDSDAGFAAVQELRDRFKLPRHVQLLDGDNAMPIDLDNVLSVDVFRNLIKNRYSVTLQELYPLDDDLMVEGEEGGYRHQLVIPFNAVPNNDAKPTLPMFAGSDESRLPYPDNIATRQFEPGSDWLYFKIYCGPSTADEVLQTIVAPVARHALSTGAATRWFFIRYGDPDWHLRFRLAGDPQRLAAEVLPLLTQASRNHFRRGSISRIQLDTYDRELRRYGGVFGAECSEQFFFADSEAVCNVLANVSGDDGLEARWLLTVQGVDAMLHEFGFNLENKLATLKTSADSFFMEFGGDKYMTKSLSAKYRQMQNLVKASLAPAEEIGEFVQRAEIGESREALLTELLQKGRAAYTRRGQVWSGASAALREAATEGRLPVSMERLAASFAHMHANRMLRGAARAHELLLYNFLVREYASTIARRKSTS